MQLAMASRSPPRRTNSGGLNEYVLAKSYHHSHSRSILPLSNWLIFSKFLYLGAFAGYALLLRKTSQDWSGRVLVSVVGRPSGSTRTVSSRGSIRNSWVAPPLKSLALSVSPRTTLFTPRPALSSISTSMATEPLPSSLLLSSLA